MNLTSHWAKGLWAITFGALGFVLCLAAPIYADAPLPTFTVTWGQYGPDDAEFRSPTRTNATYLSFLNNFSPDWLDGWSQSDTKCTGRMAKV